MSTRDITAAVTLAVVCTSTFAVFMHGRATAQQDKPTLGYENITRVHVDPDTGCQYVSSNSNRVLTPRVDSDGRIMCDKTSISPK